MKGRDIYGLLAVVPGVQDSNLSRDFTSWTSANGITINGAPVTSNNIMIDGIANATNTAPTPREPEHRRDRRGTGRHEWLYGGERPQQWRARELRDQVGVEPASRDRMVYGEARFVGGQRLRAQAPGQPKAALPRQHRRVLRGWTGRHPQGAGQPQIGEEDILFRIAGIHEGCAADPDLDSKLPDRPRADRRFFTDPSDDDRELRRHPTDHRLQDGAALSGQHHPCRPHQSDRAEVAQPADPAERLRAAWNESAVQRQLRIQRDAGTQPHRLRVPHGRGADQPVAVQLQGARGSGKQHPRQRVQPGRWQIEQHRYQRGRHPAR